jgi:NAD(P)-dependent dehydrogenase (short-subunit alcohol dehydrogenase family)
MTLSGNTILIIGAGSGTGRALARRLHALGYSVVAACRRLTMLYETIGERERMYAFELDGGRRHTAADVARRVLALQPEIQVLVHCPVGDGVHALADGRGLARMLRDRLGTSVELIELASPALAHCATDDWLRAACVDEVLRHLQVRLAAGQARAGHSGRAN